MIETALVEHDFIIRNIPSNLDGFPRPVVIMCHADSSWDIDRSFSCPLIRAKLGDQFRINITKLLRNQSTTIHFYGLHMLNNPWVGCTVHNTQCSIDSYDTFPCEFNLPRIGIFWYHSHNAQQYAYDLGPVVLDHDTIEQKIIMLLCDENGIVKFVLLL